MASTRAVTRSWLTTFSWGLSQPMSTMETSRGATFEVWAGATPSAANRACHRTAVAGSSSKRLATASQWVASRSIFLKTWVSLTTMASMALLNASNAAKGSSSSVLVLAFRITMDDSTASQMSVAPTARRTTPCKAPPPSRTGWPSWARILATPRADSGKVIPSHKSDRSVPSKSWSCLSPLTPSMPPSLPPVRIIKLTMVLAPPIRCSSSS
mmetsp:Transcript_11701/g.24132  ORF Transcript_11701/g.24132 Transcript_11701/m.24132 type:complete len:212 (-) Transcript_11701:1395-2030(-)